MAARDDVHELIKSMSKQEKRYFKLYSGFHGRKNNNYTKLFDALDKLKEFDEQALRASIRNESFARHLPSVKHRLNELILDSLVAFNESKLNGIEIRLLLDRCSVLIAKGLYEHARKVIAKARKTAEMHENFPALMSIESIEHNLFFHADFKIEATDLDEHYIKRRRTLDAQGALLTSWEFLDRVTLVGARYNSLRIPRAQELLLQSLEKVPEQSTEDRLPILARCNTLYARGLSAFQERRLEEALETFFTMMQLWEAHPALKELRQDFYGMTLHAYMGAATTLNRLELVPEVLAKLKAIVPRTEEDKVRTVELYLDLELAYYLNECNFERALETTERIEAGIAAIGNKLNRRRLINLQHNCAISYFFSDRHQAALRHINNIIDTDIVASQPDHYAFAQIFRLVNYYEAGDFDSLEARIRSTERRLKYHNLMMDFESATVGALKRLLATTHPQERKAVFSELKTALVRILHRGTKTKPLCLDEILIWAESRSSGLSPADILRKVNSLHSDNPIVKAFPPE